MYLLSGCSGGSASGGFNGTLKLSSPVRTIAPQSELFACWHLTMPEPGGSVVHFKSTTTDGAHHLIVFRLAERQQPDGTFEECPGGPSGLGSGNPPLWTYGAQEASAELVMPDGVATHIPGGTPLVLNLHYLNASDAPIDVSAFVEMEIESGAHEPAGIFVSYQPNIYIAPMVDGSVSGHCKAPNDVNFFLLTTHSHRFTTSARVHRSFAGGMGERFLETLDWEHPTMAAWSAPDFLRLGDDEEIGYACDYTNDTTAPVQDGESAATDEMCMAIGYYFPSGGKNTYCVGDASITR